ncbi:DUF6286 domain-containing protein [Actinoplanes sp. G11-F43]|uniref:DUF6286 domain-containing protein n=1 Tax=Actinoplanes sp. G11-F43 TaxID=3424130 RepID=UPI003D33B627
MSTVQQRGPAPAAVPMAAAPAPTGAGPVGVVGPVLAVLLLGAGAVTIREALTGFGIIGGAPLLPGIARTADNALTGAWPIPLGAALLLTGLGLIGTALRPRVRRTFTLTGRTGIFVTRRDVARIASDAAAEVDGVLAARSTVSRRRVVTTIHTLGAEPAPAAAVREAIGARLQRLAEPPAVQVRTRVSRPVDGRIA